MRGPGRYELIEHTADTGIRVRDARLPALFERAAAAMFDVMADIARVEPSLPEERVALSGEPDVEALLVAWLSELLSRSMAENRLYAAFEVDAVREDEEGWALDARARGAPFEEHQDAFRTELKAVTWHGLSVHEENGAWVAKVLFDQ